MISSDPFFDDAPVGYVVTDETGFIQRVNGAFLSWTRYEASELVSTRRVQDLLTPGGQIYFETHVAPLLALQHVVDDVSLKFVSRDGQSISTVGAAKRHDLRGPSNGQVWFVLVNASGRQDFEADAHRSRSRLERLQLLASALAVLVTVEDVASLTLAKILDRVHGDHGFVAIVVGDSLRIVQSQDIAVPNGSLTSSQLLAEFPETAEVLHTGTAAFVEGDPEKRSALGSRIDGVAATRLAVLPLMTEGRAVGVLYLASVTRATFDADERSFLLLFAELIARSLHVAKLHDETARRARQAGFIAQLSNALDDAMSFAARCQRLVDLVVPELADYATVESFNHEPRIVAVAHRNPELVSKLRELRASVQVSANQPHSLAVARATLEPQILVEISPEMYDQYDLGSAERSLLVELAPRSYVGLPMLGRGTLVGTLMLVMAQSNRSFEHDDVPHLADIASRAAVSLENARLYDHERLVAGSFQRELLGRPLPQDDRLHLRSVYQAGAELVEIGGDYFDSFFVDSNRIAVAVGDVVGSGIPAATVMGQLRTALRAFALEGNGPAETLNRLEVFSTSIPGSAFSSVVYAELDLRTNELVYACAGHPPPILITQERGAVALWDGRSPLLGISTQTPRSESRLDMPQGSTLVLYTDGLVEARTRSLDQGIADLIEVLQSDPLIDLLTLVSRLNVSDVHRDDICVLALTTNSGGESPTTWGGEATIKAVAAGGK